MKPYYINISPMYSRNGRWYFCPVKWHAFGRAYKYSGTRGVRSMLVVALE